MSRLSQKIFCTVKDRRDNTFGELTITVDLGPTLDQSQFQPPLMARLIAAVNQTCNVRGFILEHYYMPPPKKVAEGTDPS